MTQPLSAVLATSSAVSLLASGGSTPAATAVLGYLFGYPSVSRADGNPAATVLSALGLAESGNALEENDERLNQVPSTRTKEQRA